MGPISLFDQLDLSAQGPFGHRAWHAIESFFAPDDMDDSDAEDEPAEKNGSAPTKLLLFGGETVNLDSGDRMCTNDCLVYDTEYNVWCAPLPSQLRCPCDGALSVPLDSRAPPEVGQPRRSA